MSVDEEEIRPYKGLTLYTEVKGIHPPPGFSFYCPVADPERLRLEEIKNLQGAILLTFAPSGYLFISEDGACMVWNLPTDLIIRYDDSQTFVSVNIPGPQIEIYEFHLFDNQE